MTKAPGISVEEAKRRRAEREAASRPGAPPPPLANGHDPHHVKQREIALVGLHEMGTTDAQDNLIHGILGDAQFGMVYGESGSGKSFLTFDMAVHFALGREWMGHKVAGGGVLYIAAEGRGGWAHRVEAWCRHHALDEEARALAPFAFILETINLGRHGNGDIDAVIRAADGFAKRIEPPKLIVVDTMARATPGSNENDAADMGAFVANIDRIRRATKATPITVHHSGKNQNLGARGHSSLRAAMDTELEVERTDAGRVIRTRKSRDGRDDAEQAFNLEVVTVATDPEGKEITSCVVVPADIAAVGKRRSKDKTAWQLAGDYLSNTLVDHPASVGNDHRFPTHVPITTVARFREALERASIIDGASAGTRRVQWKRIKDALIRKGHLRIEGDYCWRPDA